MTENLQYRPFDFDDWGMIRNADGTMHATVRRPEASEGEFDQHREDGTDPFADLARRIIFFERLEEENHRLRVALKFYGDAWSFTTHPKRSGLEWKPQEQLLDDCGNIARAALGDDHG